MKNTIFFKSIICILMMSYACPFSHARESNPYKLIIDLESEVHPSDNSKQIFNNYLKTRIQYLKSILPTLKVSVDLKADGPLRDWVETRSNKYPNREIHCSFLKKLRELPLYKKDLNVLKSLTQNGTLCIAADLPEQKRDEWSMKMVHYIYETSWVQLDSELLTLTEYADTLLNGKKSPAPPTLYSWSKTAMDATYSTRSQADLDFLKNMGDLSTIFKTEAPSDLSILKEQPHFSEPMKKMLKNRLGLFPTVYIEKSAIYFTPSFGPADLPGIILHEYGHILTNQMHLHFSSDPISKTITFKRQTVYDEACAETFDRVITGSLYKKFPELEVEWLTKMALLSQVKPEDPHVVGNTVVLGSSDTNKYPIEQLRDLMKKGAF